MLLSGHVCYEFRVIEFRRLLIEKDESSGAGLAAVFLEDFLQVRNVGCEHGDGDPFLGGVDCYCTDGETGECSDVARSAALLRRRGGKMQMRIA